MLSMVEKDSTIPHIATLIGRYVKLRPINGDNDLSILYEWRNNISDLHYWNNQKILVSPQNYLEELKNENRHAHLMILSKNHDPEKIVGTIYSYNLSLIDGTVFITTYLTSSSKGSIYGAEATLLFIDYLFTFYNIRKICADIYQFNSMSIKSTERAGFVKEGTFIKQKYYDGKYWDVFRYALLRDNISKIRDHIQSIRNKLSHPKHVNVLSKYYD
jgi:RimJ/RimL family protein N-acetyltransferase